MDNGEIPGADSDFLALDADELSINERTYYPGYKTKTRVRK